MKNKGLILYVLFVLIMMVTGCEVITDIFNAGVGVGVFIALLVIGLIIWIVSRIRKKM